MYFHTLVDCFVECQNFINEERKLQRVFDPLNRKVQGMLDPQNKMHPIIKTKGAGLKTTCNTYNAPNFVLARNHL